MSLFVYAHFESVRASMQSRLTATAAGPAICDVVLALRVMAAGPPLVLHPCQLPHFVPFFFWVSWALPRRHRDIWSVNLVAGCSEVTGRLTFWLRGCLE